MPKRAAPDRAQYEEFKRVAREFGCDEETSPADTIMGRLARTPPQPRDASKTNRKSVPQKRERARD
jgi:hypothetical protein